jgi:hypothetical protein
MRQVWLYLSAVAVLWMIAGAQAKETSAGGPGCAHESAKQCVDLALEAMGGRERLQQVKSVRLQYIGHTLLAEQSYRQEPFITSYKRGQTTLDLTDQRVFTQVKLTWPESDPNQSDVDITLIVSPDGGIHQTKDGDSPCSLSEIDAARETLALGPARLLLTASDASDLHFEAPETLRSTSHTLVSFTWQKVPVRIFLNAFNHLPDAVETTQQFQDFWYFWGDVQRRIYFDNWKLTQGIPFPTNLVEERNGGVWSSTQALNVEFNVLIDEKEFGMDVKVAKQSAASHGPWNREFNAEKDTTLAPGVDLFLGSWNSTIVKQSDGIVILEAPISELYTKGVIAEARKRYPEMPVKAVLSTSDSWPHIGGVRSAVAQGLPIYILDLNRPLLDKVVKAPHTLDPDTLENSKNREGPHWKIISEKGVVGSGENRMELYPLHGPATERQYMVYFPEFRLLYASDTLSLKGDGTLYDPELMHEVVQAVKRENLKVDTVFAMHQGPVPWNQIVALMEKYQHL